MKRLHLIILIILLNSIMMGFTIQITNLRCEYKTEPLGVDLKSPRFSWELLSSERGIKQKAFQLLVSSDLNKLSQGVGDIWDSGKRISNISNQVYFDGEKLESSRKYFWKVKVWDQDNRLTISEPSYWRTGLFSESDWKGKWIGLDRPVGNDDTNSVKTVLSARFLRKNFKIKEKIKSATVFISGLGLFELYLNGEKIGDQVLVPALTEYNKETFYLAFDVTEKLHLIKNTVGVILGNGRYFAPRRNDHTNTRSYGFPKLIFQMEIEYENGTEELIISDKSWKINADGPIVKNNEYDGEYYDARKELSGWTEFGYDDSDWQNAELVERPGEKLVCQTNEPIKITEEITPIGINEIHPGTFIFDMGQNIVGWVELLVKGKRGDKVIMRFAETLKDDGSLFLDNIRTADVTDTYILRGSSQESWEPRFTYHGFRYVEVKGYPGTPDLNSIKGKVVHDDLTVTGSFACSNELINQIYKNAYWGIRGNYRSIPTDCPQRDERQGWLGDRSVECIGESFIFDISNLYSKWMNDIRNAQKENGSIPDVAPSYWPFYTDNTTWPGTYLFAADMLYTQYGDLNTIRSHFPYMEKWINYMSGFLENGIMPKDTYGDWCVPPEDVNLIHSNDPLRTTSSEYIGTAYFYFELNLMQKFAELLNKLDKADRYSKMAEKVKSAFNRKFLDDKNVVYSNNSHTANILALAFDLVPHEHKKEILERLLEKIMGESENHVGSGVIGGQWLMRTLTNNGKADVAYTLAAQHSYPSWGYMVEQGATTIWELWNGDHGDPSMNSGNHVMLLGDLIIWFYENLAGIKTDPNYPAFKKIIMKPRIPGDLNYVDASYNSLYGNIKSRWELNDNGFIWNVSVPANTSATVYVPTLKKETVFEGGRASSSLEYLEFKGWDENHAIYEIESGQYSFKTQGVIKKSTKPYVSTPVIFPKDSIAFKGNSVTVSISSKTPESMIYYTLDGSDPDTSSLEYKGPFEIASNIVLKARAFSNNCNPSITSKAQYNFVDPDLNGITWRLYRGAYLKLPDFSRLSHQAEGKIFEHNLDLIDVPEHNFALQMDSFIRIEKEGTYNFFISSNDGSKLFVNNKLLIDNDGEHGPKQLSGSVYLEKGFHPFRVEYFQSGGSKTLIVSYSSEDFHYQTLPANVLFEAE